MAHVKPVYPDVEILTHQPDIIIRSWLRKQDSKGVWRVFLKKKFLDPDLTREQIDEKINGFHKEAYFDLLFHVVPEDSQLYPRHDDQRSEYDRLYPSSSKAAFLEKYPPFRVLPEQFPGFTSFEGRGKTFHFKKIDWPELEGLVPDPNAPKVAPSFPYNRPMLRGSGSEARPEERIIKNLDEFYFEMGEDYNLWDEEKQGAYPVQRIFDAMKKFIDGLKEEAKFNDGL